MLDGGGGGNMLAGDGDGDGGGNMLDGDGDGGGGSNANGSVRRIV